MNREKAHVSDYMTEGVDVVSADATVATVISRLDSLGEHDGFPVCQNGQLAGLITARQLLLSNEDDAIREIMETDTPVASPSMRIKNAARVMLREGTSDLPVVNEQDELVGIITHTDVLRSQIERTTPSKVGNLITMLGRVHNIEPTAERTTVPIAALIPTQGTIFADELQGRRYELENGLAEPLVVVQSEGELLLADGHHRAVAASDIGLNALDAYVIDVGEATVGMRETARKQRLQTVDDIRVDETESHAFTETIGRLRSE